MVFDGNVLCSWGKLRRGSNCDTTVVILPDCLKTGFLGINPKVLEISFIRPVKGVTSLIAVDKTIYSLSVVMRAISVYGLLSQVIGHLANIIMKPVLESTDSGESWSPSVQPLAKSASTKYSRPLEKSG